LTADTAADRLSGLAEALIGWLSGNHDSGLPPDEVCQKIEILVPKTPDGEEKTALIATHILWHEWVDPAQHRVEAIEFKKKYQSVLDTPSPSAFTVSILSNFAHRIWSVDEWSALAESRNSARRTNNEAPLPAPIDALIQLIAADHLEAASRHDEAVQFAANAVAEMPGNPALLEWEARLVAGNHDPDFDTHLFLFGKHLDNTHDGSRHEE
ncbi:hypothetical protein ABZX73_16865, partial [Brevibacterium casei]